MRRLARHRLSARRRTHVLRREMAALARASLFARREAGARAPAGGGPEQQNFDIEHWQKAIILAPCPSRPLSSSSTRLLVHIFD